MLLASWLVSASDLSYTGTPLSLSYSGPMLIDNSQMKYSAIDKLIFSTQDYLEEQAPHLLPLRKQIDTWSAFKNIHPKILSTVLSNYFGEQIIESNTENKQTVLQIAAGLSESFAENKNDPLAASKAVVAISHAFGFALNLPSDFTVALDPVHSSIGSGPPIFSYFQPPWTRGESWGGGGGHSNTGGSGPRNSLDFWKTFVSWGGNTDDFWVSASQGGIARVWSSCSVSVIHPNGWTTSYYHLDNVQVSDMQDVTDNHRLSNYADNIDQALCDGGGSSGPHVHFSISYDGNAVVIDEANVDFSSWKYHDGDENYDSDCSRSYYTIISGDDTGDIVCPFYTNLINDTEAVVDLIFMNGFN
ncbi:MAG: hypothetical protein ACSHWU_10870 [Marinicella sp.]